MGIGSNSDCSCDLPEDVLILSAACEDHFSVASLSQGSRYLKDPNSVWVALGIEGKTLVNQNTGAPFIETRLYS